MPNPELVFDVTALDYVFPALPRAYAFGADGGTLGRDERNTLVLPDRYQRVSRLHAEITFVRGVPILSNKSRTLVVNVGDQEVLPGDSAIVQDEDVIEIGPYLLSTRLRDGPASIVAEPVLTAMAVLGGPTAATLTQAFARGAELPAAAFETGLGLSLDQVERIGSMVRLAVAGAMDLLAAGAITRREIRVNSTSLADQSNNPLRFLPTSEAALVQLLTGQLPGFMHGTQAMPDAFAELLAHDAGVMAGMHAALADLLVRLDPRAADASLIASPALALVIAPSADKARWWDTHNVQYARVAALAEDDFEAAWGRVFVDAYSSAAERTRAGNRVLPIVDAPPNSTRKAPCLAS